MPLDRRSVITWEKRAVGETRISDDTSKIPVWVIPTDEEHQIARHTIQLLGAD